MDAVAVDDRHRSGGHAARVAVDRHDELARQQAGQLFVWMRMFGQFSAGLYVPMDDGDTLGVDESPQETPHWFLGGQIPKA